MPTVFQFIFINIQGTLYIEVVFFFGQVYRSSLYKV